MTTATRHLPILDHAMLDVADDPRFLTLEGALAGGEPIAFAVDAQHATAIMTAIATELATLPATLPKRGEPVNCRVEPVTAGAVGAITGAQPGNVRVAFTFGPATLAIEVNREALEKAIDASYLPAPAKSGR